MKTKKLMKFKDLEEKINTKIQRAVFDVLKDGKTYRRDDIFKESGTTYTNVGNVLLLFKGWGVIEQPKRGHYKLLFKR